MRSLAIDPKDAVPIWRQIEEGVRHLVASGALRPGGTLPSVREMARDLSVNPNTVVKAYQRLTDAGILVVKRGEGTFVSETPPAIPRAERSRTLREGATRYASLAVTIGAPHEETVDELKKALDGLNGRKGGRP
jgi:GntR family transcriptional regulator